MDRYKFLTGEDLGLKSSTVEQTKFAYSPLGTIFNEGLNKHDDKEGLSKRLNNNQEKKEDESKKQLDAIKNMNVSSKPRKTIVFLVN